MATDVKLDQVDGTYLVLEANVLKTEASDFIIDAPSRHQGGGPLRRALVHDQGDGLTVNFNGDYPGGINLVHVAAITPKKPQNSPFAATLVVHGDISYEVVSLVATGGNKTTTHMLTDELNKLQTQINDLAARVKALEAK